ncbi:helix-turn-helix transcriptional regulator [Crocosphaera sp.]|uniref:helix-turn-helix transcriptional regulator n=1 Tax=Crocosphaera sp. TaxID=2729996 RepID=UPI002622C797|nr:helix-turn-helix transcriptional regulator [Crocosphaera sp.]MDJ0583008.1 helix-turn-helix transcriptional regulator [Crocosphaera sp.]
MSKQLGQVMSQLRKKAGLTQRQVALAIGITDQTVSNWETGQRKPQLTPAQTLKLCNVLNCDLEELASKDK